MIEELLNKPVRSITKLSLNHIDCPYIGLVTYNNGNQVVVKEMTPENRREIAILNRIGKHENIVEKIGEFNAKEKSNLTNELIGKFGEQASKGIFFEYIEGGNLHNLSTGQQKKYIIPVVYDISSALEHSHNKRVVHADVKPFNIVITKNGHYKGAKLIDFDCSLYLGQRKIMNERKNTENYRSPEQVYDGMVGFRSDIFSLGIIFYEILSGKPLSFGQKYYLDERDNPSRDKRLTNLINAMLEKKAKDRPTATEVKKELEQYKKAYK